MVLGMVSFPIRAIENGRNEIRIISDGLRVWEDGSGTPKFTCVDAGSGHRWQAQIAHGHIEC